MVEEDDDPLDCVQKNKSIETQVYKDKGKELTKECINFLFPKYLPYNQAKFSLSKKAIKKGILEKKVTYIVIKHGETKK